MFKEDCRYVADFCQSSPQNLLRTAIGVHGTVQQATKNLDRIVTQYDTQGFKKGDTFFWRMNYIKHFSDNKEYFHGNMMSILASKKKNIPDRILKLFLEAEGLGLPKANFLAQLATANKAFSCLDLNNIKWYGIDPSITDYNKKTKSEEVLYLRRKNYLDTVRGLGGGEYLWNAWMHGISDKEDYFKSAEDVSRKHRHWFTTWENQYPTL